MKETDFQNRDELWAAAGMIPFLMQPASLFFCKVFADPEKPYNFALLFFDKG